MALLGWVPYPGTELGKEQPRFIHNASARFESRWSTVKILESNSVLLKGMAGSTLGVWLAHGEGKVHFPNPDHLAAVLNQGLAPIRYVDDSDSATELYPFNPNGSPEGIASLVSPCGRY